MSKPTTAELRAKVLQYAKDYIGKVAGNGQCAALAGKALTEAKAKTSVDYGPITSTGDYRWGDRLAGLQDVQPGDILQFSTDFTMKLARTRKLTLRFTDGSWLAYTEVTWTAYPRNHHTAIASSTH